MLSSSVSAGRVFQTVGVLLSHVDPVPRRVSPRTRTCCVAPGATFRESWRRPSPRKSASTCRSTSSRHSNKSGGDFYCCSKIPAQVPRSRRPIGGLREYREIPGSSGVEVRNTDQRFAEEYQEIPGSGFQDGDDALTVFHAGGCNQPTRPASMSADDIIARGEVSRASPPRAKAARHVLPSACSFSQMSL